MSVSSVKDKTEQYKIVSELKSKIPEKEITFTIYMSNGKEYKFSRKNWIRYDYHYCDLTNGYVSYDYLKDGVSIKRYGHEILQLNPVDSRQGKIWFHELDGKYVEINPEFVASFEYFIKETGNFLEVIDDKVVKV